MAWSHGEAPLFVCRRQRLTGGASPETERDEAMMERERRHEGRRLMGEEAVYFVVKKSSVEEAVWW